MHLFAFLVLNRHRPWPRYLIADRLWPDRSEEAARRCLRTELWRLRRLVDASGAAGTTVVTDGDALRFHSPGHRLDVAELENAAAIAARGGSGPLGVEEHGALESAAALYRGELLEGCDDEWCLPLRNRCRDAWLAVVERLMDHHCACGEWECALAAGARLIDAEPLHERARHKLLRCRWLAGDRTGALRDYTVFSRQLALELGIEPIAETRQLLRQIRDGDPSPEAPGRLAPASVPGARRDAVSSALTDLQDNLLRAVRSVQRTLQALTPRR